MSTFFMRNERNEIFFEDIQKCQHVLLFAFIIWHTVVIIRGVTRGLSQGGNLAKRGPLASTQKKT